MKVSCLKLSPPIGALFIANHFEALSSNLDITFECNSNKETFALYPDGSKRIYHTANELARILAEYGNEDDLLGRTALEKSEVDSWLCFAANELAREELFKKALTFLHRGISQGKFLVGGRVTISDYMVLATLIANPTFKPTGNLLMWFNRTKTLPAVKKSINAYPETFQGTILSTVALSAAIIVEGATSLDISNQEPERIAHIDCKNAKSGVRLQEGKFVELPGAEMGQVVVRFPPEASGYLHIGHAKAALLNQYYQQAFQGQLIMRFDDTNPAKENVHFERVILEDVALLEINPDLFTHTSQYFDQMLEYCEQLLKSGDAYVDDTDAERMREQREGRIESANRNNGYEKNRKMWEEMITGSQIGQTCCVRAKIDMQSPNGCMRDPTIYRCKNEPHPRTGTTYKVYPTYDFACPIVDAIENVTHTLRTMEYHDRDAQFYWFIEKLGLRRPYIWEYSRLSMTNTVLSKRKLTWFVQNGYVDGWDDARMPTVRGVLRRGMTVEGLKQFIIAQGSSRSVVFMEWDKIWAFNKKIIDPIAPRFTALDYNKIVVVNVKDVKTEKLSVAKHPKNAEIGMKDIWISNKILIEMADALLLKEGENTTFINWGNLLIQKINKDNGIIKSIDAEPNLDNKDYKKTLKLTWLAKTDEAKFTPTYCVHFDHLISKALLGKDEDFKQFIAKDTRKEVQMLGDPELKKLKQGDIIQLQRIGFFRVDIGYKEANPHTCREQPVVLFYIPDGHTKESPNINVGKARRMAEEKQASPQKSITASAIRSAATINAELNAQADLVRDLKATKALKTDVDPAVKLLLTLKAEYKTVTGSDWKQGAALPVAASTEVKPPSGQCNAAERTSSTINAELNAQADLVRDLKAKKASKTDVDPAVKLLLTLKAEYKTVTGSDWKQGAALPVAASTEPPSGHCNAAERTSSTINAELNPQADLVRDLKAKKAAKTDVDPAVKLLLSLKAEYKTVTGSDWKQGAALPVAASTEPPSGQCNAAERTSLTINAELNAQTDLLPNLEANKAPKAVYDEAAKIVLAFSSFAANVKTVAGTDWQPDVFVETQPQAMTSGIDAGTSPAAGDSDTAKQLTTKGNEQVAIASALNSKDGTIEQIEATMMPVLDMGLLTGKTEHETSTGNDFSSAGCGKQRKENKPKEAKQKKTKSAAKEKPQPIKDSKEDDSALKKQTRLCIEAKKEVSFSSWYSEVITKGEMIEYYDVSGCYILRPWSFSIWDAIREWFDAEIKKLGVQNCYFPIFVSKAVLEKEKTHIADFAPEVAWVTKSGNSEMPEPIAVRPTSETAMYPAYAKWIQSHRDLPIKLNQWNNVVRWEFSNPQPFLRTREFLWQEGHTAHATAEAAQEEVRTILELYARVYTDLLAVPVIRGRKTEKEKFAGGDFTTTVEAYVGASGRAVQGATSHFLGQNFSRMFDITYEVPGKKEKKYVEQTSWGISTRTIGVMIMVHGDNTGLVLPPRIACIQTVIVPCGITAKSTDDDRNVLQRNCVTLEQELRTAGIRVHGDYRDNQSPGWKYSHWELKGVPLRVEYGPKDIEKSQLVAVRRDTGEKFTIQRSSAPTDIIALLDNIQQNLYNNALKDMDSHKVIAKNWDVFCSSLDKKNIILAPFCGTVSCEEKIKAESARMDAENVEPGAPSMGGKSLCIPFDQPADLLPTDKCIHPACANKPQFYTLFGRSY